MSEWISCEDRLPDIGQSVLTNHSEIEIYNTCLYLGKWFESLETGDDLTPDVTHWMPLPEPPNV